MGSKGLGGHARIRGRGEGGSMDPIGKSHIWVDLDLNSLPPLTKFPGSAQAGGGGGGGNLFHWNAFEQIA